MSERRRYEINPSFADLFTTQEDRDEAKLEKVQMLPLGELNPFPDHPFEVRDDEEMEKLVDSIRVHGVLMPAIARTRPDGSYELVAGHRRKRACELAGLQEMPVLVREMDDDSLITVDDIYSATGELLFRAGDLIATSAPTDENGYTTFTCDFPMRGEFYGMEGVRIPENTTANSGKYRIVELRPPQGYYLDAPDQEFEFVYQDAETPVIEMENTFENDATSFFVSKRKLTGDEELPGATLTIQDKDGNVVRQWVSGDTPTEIRGLQFDKIYTLVETAAPNGYEVAESIRFKLVQRKDENGDLLNEADVFISIGKDWLIFDHWTLMEDGMVIMRDAPSPETPPTPENPAPTPKPEQPVETPAPTPKPVTSLPQTGDNAPIGLLAGIAAAAGIAFGFLMHKRRRHNLPAEPEIEPLEDEQEEDHNG